MASNHTTTSKAEIVHNLWIGPIFALRELPKGPSWTVISLLSNEKLLYMARSFLNGTPHHHIVWNISDNSNSTLLSDNLIRALKEIDKAIIVESRPCLVHCAHGQSRSAAVIAAWLLSSRTCTTLQHAMDCIRMARPQVQPNLGFVAALKKLERHQGNVPSAMSDGRPSMCRGAM